MYWNDDDSSETCAVPDDVVDVLFSMDCRLLPVDHAYALREALCETLPWLAHAPRIALHEIHVAGSQNGWERPEHGTGSYLRPSRRTRLTIRAPKARALELLAELPGRALSVADCPLAIGPGKTRALSRETTLIARRIVGRTDEDEASFLARCAHELALQDIRMRKALCGKVAMLANPSAPLLTRSLLLAGLTAAESLGLQQRGLGPQPLLGCGIFIPHKGIDPIARDR